MQAAAAQGVLAATTNIESDLESEKSGSTAPHGMMLYGSITAGHNNTSFNVLASDSETDGNFSDTGSCFGRGTTMQGGGADTNAVGNIDNISEHSSDEADSDSEEVLQDGKKKDKGEKGDKPKTKKKKNREEKGANPKKAKDKEAGAKKSSKDKSAPSKKNFTESKEKEYSGKEKQKASTVKSKAQKVEKEKNATAAKAEKADPPPKAKKPKQQEEGKQAGQAQAGDPAKESPQKKKKQQKLNTALVHTLPKNIEEQKQVFFESGCTTNP